MELRPEQEVFATDITRLPKDPTLKYGGAVFIDKKRFRKVQMNPMPRQMTPIVQTREDPQLELLKQILSRLPGRNK